MLPVVIQSIFIAGINMVDTMFISNLIGEDATAGVGSSNAVFQLILFTVISACVAGGIFTGQYFGAKNTPKVRETVSWKIVIGTSIALVLTGVLTAAALAPQNDQGLFYFFLSNNGGPNSAAIKHAKEYWALVSWSFVLLGLVLPIQFTFVEWGKPLIPMIVSGTAFIINSTLNPLFMTGYNGLIKNWRFDNYISGDAVRRYIEGALENWEQINRDIQNGINVPADIAGLTPEQIKEESANIWSIVDGRGTDTSWNTVWGQLSENQRVVVVDLALWNVPGAILRNEDIVKYGLSAAEVNNIEQLRDNIVSVTSGGEGLNILMPKAGQAATGQLEGMDYGLIEYDGHNPVFRVTQWGMGVKGAAWGTITSRVFEAATYVGLCFAMPSVRHAFSPFSRDQVLSKDLFVKVLGNFGKIAFSDVLFSLSLALVQIVMIKLGGPTSGDLGMKAIVITMTIVNLFFAIFQGYRTLIPYYVGTRLGAGDPEGAKLAFKRFCGMVLMISFILALMLLMIGIFGMGPIFRLPAGSMLLFYTQWHTVWHAFGFFFLSFTMVFLSVLRVGGRAMLSSVLDVISAYVFIVGWFLISLGISSATLPIDPETGVKAINWTGVTVALVGNGFGELMKCIVLGIAVYRVDWARTLV